MKFGLLTSILDGMSFEEAVDFASSLGLECLEVASWPAAGGAKRRYAGVCHIDAEALTPERAEHYRDYAASHGIQISALGYYPNTLDPDLEKRADYIAHLHALIDAAPLVGTDLVTTFLGRDPKKDVEDNLEIVQEVWPEILDHARERGVRIAIENCPMLFTADEWPGGQNIMTSPANWRKVFEILPYENLGINYDPSHFVWQQIDYIRPLYEFRDRIFHVHFKDIKLLKDRLADVGVMAYPLEYMRPKIPGLGDVDWGAYVSALTDIGFSGCGVIEVEDKAFEGSLEESKRAVAQSAKYLRNFVG
jgi:sugar phosphate isomerase/epimerase